MERIKTLLEKYWDGETSLEEEKELKQYFNSPNVAEGLKRYAPLFAFYKEERKREPRKDLASSLGLRARIIPMPHFGRVAVALTLLGVLAYGLWTNPLKDETPAMAKHVVIDDPEQAYAELRKALAMTASYLNETEKVTSPISELSMMKKYGSLSTKGGSIKSKE
ncbi:hypothetical protein FUAX_42850 (plasmid) [Fulvitalea axinellae]|uniref:Anti sigma-E protein RseA N-terminal domain-containing protein n=1 Tax=Fulvitalea axinellae TaxID=1182444 RepID=A0AAU9CUY8_9BACT|nr:hypothetical protein FUAX_42850 [Fulvitalea axinellae]